VNQSLKQMGWWNYRVMKREVNPGEFEFSIHEVYYDDDGKIEGTTGPLIPSCSSEEGLMEEMEILKSAFGKETLIYKD
jgi:hypothetical protein